MEEPKSIYSFDDRLVQFAGECVFFVRKLGSDDACRYYGNQILRSSGSACLNYGEAQGAVTDKDYVNKMSLVIKELKESRNCVKVLSYIEEGEHKTRSWIQTEVEELIAIAFSMMRKKQ